MNVIKSFIDKLQQELEETPLWALKILFAIDEEKLEDWSTQHLGIRYLQAVDV